MSTTTTRSRTKKAPAADDPIVEEAKPQAPPPDTYKLFDKSNTPIFTSAIPESDAFTRLAREQHFVEHLPNILHLALDDGIDPRDIVIRNRNLTGINLAGMQLVGIDFAGCNFQDADLRNTNLSKANLEECVFSRARMSGARVYEANVDGTSFDDVDARYIGGLILLELDTWLVTAYRSSSGQLRIKAGCRNFSYEEAVEHWQDRDDRMEIRAALPFIAAVAQRRGWRLEADSGTVGGHIIAGDGPGEGDEDDEEDEG